MQERSYFRTIFLQRPSFQNVWKKKIVFHAVLSLLAGGCFCSVLRQEVPFPCVETFSVVLVIINGLKASTVFSSCNKEASISTKEAFCCDKETLFLLFLPRIKTLLIIRNYFLTQMVCIYSKINISMSFRTTCINIIS